MTSDPDFWFLFVFCKKLREKMAVVIQNTEL